MNSYFLVFLGAGLGGALRYGVNLNCARWLGADFPWGVLTINVTGCLAMGLIAGWFAFKQDGEGGQDLRLFLTTGVLGGYTTFSAFALDWATLWMRGAYIGSILYVLASVLFSLIAVFAGLAIMRSLS